MLSSAIVRGFLLSLLFFISSCSYDVPKRESYLYSPNDVIPEGNAIIISRVFDNRSDKERASITDSSLNWVNVIGTQLNYVAGTVNEGIRKNVLGVKEQYFAAKAILVDQQGNKYYLGDYYKPEIHNSEYRRLKVGNKGQLEVYPGMAAYSVLSLPAGEYKIVGCIYYSGLNLAKTNFRNLKTTGDYLYPQHLHKVIKLNPKDVFYLGDIGLTNASIEINSKFGEAQSFVDLAYSSLAKDLRIYKFN